MKKNILLISILFYFALDSKCQNINLIPLYTSHEFDVIDGTINLGNKFNFIYVNFDYKSAIDSNTLISHDTTFYEVRQIDFNTGIEKKYQEKYKTDTTYWPAVFEPFYNNYDGRFYLNNCKLKTNTLITGNSYISLCKHFNVVSYDTNLLNRKSVELPIFLDTSRSYYQANKLIYKDSFIYAISSDSDDVAPYLCKFNLSNGVFLDSLKMVDKYPASNYHTYYKNMNLLNDSTLVCLSTHYVSYINLKNLQLLDTLPIKWSWSVGYPQILNVKYNTSDSSYIFNGGRNYDNWYYKISASGLITKLFEVPIVQLPTFYNRLNPLDRYHWDYIYPNHMYTSLVPIFPLTDTLALCHSTMAGVTDWIKLIKAPDTCSKVTLTAMADSSVVGFVAILKSNPIDSNDFYDQYYFRVDQNGNQVSPTKINSILLSNETPILYPNPCNEKICIANINLNAIKSIVLLNSFGQIIKSLPLNLSINTSELPSSTYFVSVVTKESNYILKFVKQ